MLLRYPSTHAVRRSAQPRGLQNHFEAAAAAAAVAVVAAAAASASATTSDTWHRGPPIHHFDLYRLDRQSDMSRLDLAQSFNGAVSLVEWAERLSEQQLPQQRLEVHIDIMHETAGLPAAGASIEQFKQEQQQQQQVTCLPIVGQEQQQQQQQEQQQEQQQQQHLAGCAVTILLPTPQLSQVQQPASGSGTATVHGSSVVADTAPIAGAGPIPPCDGFSEMDEEAEDPYTDQRWRKVTLKAFGAGWVGRLQHLAKQMCSTTVL
eukprot:gene9522-biopygen11411